ncbi:MAG: OmpA family protein [Bacteroidetes bacterium]|nr:OmpA family protein [Bacteroidota bacterium]
MKRFSAILLILTLTFSFGFYGCGASNTLKGTAIGTAAGGILGGVIGKQAGNTTLGAIIGAAVGGTAGYFIGNYMDEQAQEIQNDIEGATVERVGEGIKITFDSGILFKTNSSTLEAEAKTNIAKLSKILNKYEDTAILVTGHTDSKGTEEHNQTLSEQRAKSVVDYTVAQAVSSARFSMQGLGEKEPVATNDTEEGRRQNRRVEIAIFANDDLKAAAEKGKIN